MNAKEFLETKPLKFKDPLEGYVIPYSYLCSLLEEHAKEIAIGFVKFITEEDSPYSVMYGGTPELEKDYRFATEETDHTIEDVYQQYLKQKQQP